MKISRCIVYLLAAFSFAGSFHDITNYRKLHSDALVVDTHNDVVQYILNGLDISSRTVHGHSDLPRFRDGGLDVEMFSIWVPPEKTYRSYYEQADEQIDSIESFVLRNPTHVGLATNSRDVEKLIGEGKFVAMLGMEGGHPIDNDLKKLEHFYRRGVRYMTLTWNNSTDWATSAKDETDQEKHLPRKGLTPFGKKVVRKMNELGMMIDISHVGEQTFWDVMKVTRKPVIASHSSVWALCHHRRNLKDEQLRTIAKNGGVVCINFNPPFIDSTYARKENKLLERLQPRLDSIRNTIRGDEFIKDQYATEALMSEFDAIRPPLSTLIDHFDYVAKLVGADHVGIGSDFNGIAVAPKEMDDVTYLPNITRELLKRGYSESDVRKILGGNFMRVLRAVERK
ncbi:MAG: membrane dipeptidase [Ignavibacteriae bacterium]|nr:membrane dipeptidase [Ignavibacteria bacterium]MBI3363803.1 membrane dipeptidase [Ignavibacteriota bacterium]